MAAGKAVLTRNCSLRHVTGTGGHAQTRLEDNRTLSKGKKIKGQSGVRRYRLVILHADTHKQRAHCCCVNSGVGSSMQQQGGSYDHIKCGNSKATKQHQEEINERISEPFQTCFPRRARKCRSHIQLCERRPCTAWSEWWTLGG